MSLISSLRRRLIARDWNTLERILNDLYTNVLNDNQPLSNYIIKTGTRAFTGNQSMGGHRLTSLADPVNLQDAVTKSYLATGISGFIPYTGATADLNLGAHDILADNAFLTGLGEGLVKHDAGEFLEIAVPDIDYLTPATADSLYLTASELFPVIDGAGYAKYLFGGNNFVGTGQITCGGIIPVGGILSYGETDYITYPSGPGTRLMWIPSKAAFRVGQVANDAWDYANIGFRSVAFENGKATADGAFASQTGTANGINSVAFSSGTTGPSATGSLAFASATVNGSDSFGLGDGIIVNGVHALVFGENYTNTLSNAFEIGFTSLLFRASEIGGIFIPADVNITGITTLDNILKIIDNTTDFYTTFQGGVQAGDITYILPTASANGHLRNTTGTLDWDTTVYISSITSSTPTNLTGFLKGNGSLVSVDAFGASTQIPYVDTTPSDGFLYNPLFTFDGTTLGISTTLKINQSTSATSYLYFIRGDTPTFQIRQRGVGTDLYTEFSSDSQVTWQSAQRLNRLGTFYLAGQTPTINLQVQQSTGGFSFNFFAPTIFNTVTSATVNGGLIGCVGNIGSPSSVSYYFLDPTPTAAFNNAVLKIGPLGIGVFTSSTNAPAFPLDITGNGAISGKLRVGSSVAPTVALDVTGAALISSTLGVTGLTTATGGVKIIDGANLEKTVSDLTITTAAQKTIVLSPTVYNDLYSTVDPARTSGTSQVVMLGNIREIVFSNGDSADFPAIELIHGYKEGTDVEFHMHIVTRGTNASAYHVRFTIEYTWANVDAVFPATTTLDVETTIAGGTTEFTHKYIDMGTISGSGKTIGSQMKFVLKKIASASSDAPSANNPYVLQVGIHYQCDTIGSRQEHTK